MVKLNNPIVASHDIKWFDFRGDDRSIVGGGHCSRDDVFNADDVDSCRGTAAIIHGDADIDDMLRRIAGVPHGAAGVDSEVGELGQQLVGGACNVEQRRAITTLGRRTRRCLLQAMEEMTTSGWWASRWASWIVRSRPLSLRLTDNADGFHGWEKWTAEMAWMAPSRVSEGTVDDMVQTVQWARVVDGNSMDGLDRPI
ncbi:hypothetical protein ACLOJK_037681 [Asimina triloba]